MKPVVDSPSSTHSSLSGPLVALTKKPAESKPPISLSKPAHRKTQAMASLSREHERYQRRVDSFSLIVSPPSLQHPPSMITLPSITSFMLSPSS